MPESRRWQVVRRSQTHRTTYCGRRQNRIAMLISAWSPRSHTVALHTRSSHRHWRRIFRTSRSERPPTRARRSNTRISGRVKRCSVIRTTSASTHHTTVTIHRTILALRFRPLHLESRELWHTLIRSRSSTSPAHRRRTVRSRQLILH